MPLLPLITGSKSMPLCIFKPHSNSNLSPKYKTHSWRLSCQESVWIRTDCPLILISLFSTRMGILLVCAIALIFALLPVCPFALFSKGQKGQIRRANHFEKNWMDAVIWKKRLWSYSKIWPLTLRVAVARGALKFFRLTRYHWCLFGPLNLANLWKAVNRIRFKMGQFSRTQIRTLTSSSPKKKKNIFLIFGGFFISCPHVLSAFWQTVTKKIDQFLDPPGHVFGQILGL